VHFEDRSITGRPFAVLGLARTGIAAARFLARRGARVEAFDLQSRDRLPPAVADLEALGVPLVLGPHPIDRLLEAETIVVSPGIEGSPAVAAAETAGIPVVSEVELACRFLRAPIVAVTGTNGKSTVTTLIGRAGEAAGRPTFAGANLGTPLVDAVGAAADVPEGLVVAELSSFQLERTGSLRARVAVLLNVTDDHLDRHGSFDAYAALKGRVFRNQGPGDDAVVPRGDAVCEGLAAAGAAAVRRFGGAGADASAEGEDLVVRWGGRERFRMARGALRIRGAHNADNALASALAASLVGIPGEATAAAIASFAGLPHRMQPVGEAGGVLFLDDSKATNVGAALRAIEGLDRRAVWIAGGREKGGSYAPLRAAAAAKVVRLVAIGEARTALRAELGDVVPFEEARTLEEAVRIAHAAARPGEAVLLAPACSSYDMFRDYVERGERFAAAAAALGAVRAGGEGDGGRG
jgi:UDP-N-acetylmuramoylalanine--D-glutamate ligase